MAWCETADVYYAYNALFAADLADDNKDGSADTGVIAYAIEGAMEDIFAYTGGRYPTITPDYTGTIPTIYKQLCSQRAAIRLRRRQGLPGGEWEESIQKVLEDIRDGRAVVRGWTDSSLPDSTTREVCSEFSDKNLDEYGEPGPEYMSDGGENDPNDASTSDDD